MMSPRTSSLAHGVYTMSYRHGSQGMVHIYAYDVRTISKRPVSCVRNARLTGARSNTRDCFFFTRCVTQLRKMKVSHTLQDKRKIVGEVYAQPKLIKSTAQRYNVQPAQKPHFFRLASRMSRQRQSTLPQKTRHFTKDETR